MEPAKAWRLVGPVVLVVGLVLQAYLRYYPYIKPGCRWHPNASHKIVAFGDPQITGFLQLQKWRKKLDILGNDRFLAQIAETVRTSLDPEYVTVLGDLLSSQWIPTPEFEARVDRYAKIFDTTHPGSLINITGNHDIGYHGEFTSERVSRYERRFGKLNYVIDRSSEQPPWRIVVLNSLSLDGPPLNDEWYNETLSFLGSLQHFEGSTVLFTHIPMYKPTGICRDGPQFAYYPEEQGGGLRQQNHLSSSSTDLVLNSVFGSRGGIVLCGHDHEGCESSYNWDEASGWQATPGLDGGYIKEATVRSMMGEFNGNAGLLSGVVNEATNELDWQFTLCPFHVQHLWWVTQVLTIIGVAQLPALFAL